MIIYNYVKYVQEVRTMIIELPQNPNFYKSGGQVKIEDGILKIWHLVSWREFIYKLTISTKGKIVGTVAEN